MRNFISVNDVDDIDALVKQAIRFKENPYVNKSLGVNRKIGLLFLNPSLRTRISTQIAAQNLGLEPIVLNIDKDGWALEFEEGAIMNGTTVEHIKDAAPVLGAYFDILCVRTFPSLKNREEDYAETILSKFIEFAGVPVVSLESATLHPLQSLADIITIEESMKAEKIIQPKIVLTWAPHIKPLPQCVANSFAQWMNAWGKANFVIAHPKGFELSKEFTKNATIMYNQDETLADADFVYVKNWSMLENYGQLSPELHEDWMLTNEKLKNSNAAKVMHCLPVRRNVELSDEILDGQNSLVSKQAANRVWSAQSVLNEILKSNFL